MATGRNSGPTRRPAKQTARFDQPHQAAEAGVVQKKLEAERRRPILDPGILCWLFLAIFVTHHFDVIDAVMYDPRVDRDRLFTAEVLIGISVIVTAYALVVVDAIQGKDYLKATPWAVPVATFTALAGWGLFWVSMWPVWGILSFLIVPALFMGLIFSVLLCPI
mmetsp:Transcript_25430/g.66569  ORF Transcript_25430/g.66569 Transcript_25430/m.66569 type:complete len:164 (-) Transcript_25430:235-726(-)